MATFSNFRDRINSVGKKKNVTPGIPAPSGLAVANDGPYAPLLPAVNLLPSVFAQRMANRALVRRFLWAGAVLVLLLGVLFGLKFVVQFFNQSQLATLQANAANYNRQLQTLQPYQNYKTSIGNERSTLGQVLSKDIDMAKILSTLNLQAAQYNVQYTNVGLTVGGAGSCIADPFAAQPTVGCITLSGTAPSQAGVSNFFNTLNGTRGFLNAVPASLSAADANYTFNGTVSFNEGFYSNAYADLSSDLDQLLAASGTDTTTTPLATLLKTRYPTVFTSTAQTVRITTLGTQVCSFATAPITSVTLASRVVAYGQTVQITIPAAQSGAIAKDIIATSCPTNTKNVTGGNL